MDTLGSKSLLSLAAAHLQPPGMGHFPILFHRAALSDVLATEVEASKNATLFNVQQIDSLPIMTMAKQLESILGKT